MSRVDSDIVVVRFGAAGAGAALRAAELGASVQLLEKQAQTRPTPSTRMSGGHIMTVNDVAAGELGQAMGLLYPAGGCNISEALCFGRIAVESALDA